jgi:hypothetical protein
VSTDGTAHSRLKGCEDGTVLDMECDMTCAPAQGGKEYGMESVSNLIGLTSGNLPLWFSVLLGSVGVMAI